MDELETTQIGPDGIRRIATTRLPVGETVSILLLADERLADPTSTKRFIYGPAIVDAYLWPDGGLDVRVRDR